LVSLATTDVRIQPPLTAAVGHPKLEVIVLEYPEHATVVTPGVMRDKQLRVPWQELHQGRAGARTNHTGCCTPTQCGLQVFQVPLDLEKTAGKGMTRGNY